METRYFDIGATPCKVSAPTGITATRAIIAIHGFGGSKESPTIQALSRALCPQGIAVYCFDFPAHGKHPWGGEAFTVETCADALLSVARYVRDAQFGQVGVFATSFGGYMALHCMEGLADALGDFALVLKAPAVKMADTCDQVILEGQRDQLEKLGWVQLDYDRPLEVHRSYLDGLRAHDVCKPYGRPMLVIHGTEDAVVTPDHIADFMRQNPRAELVQIPAADHEFKGEGQLDQVIEAAQAYFARLFG